MIPALLLGYTFVYGNYIYIAVRYTSRQGQWKKASPGIVPLVFRTASEATRTASDF